VIPLYAHIEAHLPDDHPIDQSGLFASSTIMNAVKQRRQKMVRSGLEAERLDRIRNPSKYLGK